ncbi:P-loop containing nucleoside triphosphate hydrolase protein, partial [Gymnopus androsaceus JB14]
EPDEWQAHLIHRVLQGYDGICVAATGLGKSLIFEGVAKLAGKGKVALVVCPLKALERDQVEHARRKGIDAIMINEDTEKDAHLWEQMRTTAQMVYLSPEMALSESFRNKLWKDSKFRSRLAAVFIDEAHCIDDWGEDDFRPLYRQLDSLRGYTGMEVPFVACTATCKTSTFDLLWKTLAFGNRPVWGIDVGAERPNLFFHTRILENTHNPVLDALNILPTTITSDTHREDIPKCLFYFKSEGACREAVQTLRKVLPEHLRDSVYPFSSDMSETAKEKCWKGLGDGSIRIVCATDAAGMGCSIPDVEYSIIFDLPQGLSVVAQRWGRAGRARDSLGVCILLVPSWAF